MILSSAEKIVVKGEGSEKKGRRMTLEVDWLRLRLCLKCFVLHVETLEKQT